MNNETETISSAERFKLLADKRRLSPEEKETLKNEWIKDVGFAFSKMRKWIEAEGIKCGYTLGCTFDPVIGKYDFPTLRITIDGGEEVIIKPEYTSVVSSVQGPTISITGSYNMCVRISQDKDRKWIILDRENFNEDNFFEALIRVFRLEG